MASTQDNFQVVGENLITISNMLLSNKNVTKLLYYTSKTPLSGIDLTELELDSMMNKNIRLVPKVPDENSEKGSFIIILLDNYTVDSQNESSLIVNLRFDVVCPMDEWLINEKSLRPFLILSEVKAMFDGFKIKGIGKLRFNGIQRIVMTEIYAGYTMLFTNYEFS